MRFLNLPFLLLFFKQALDIKRLHSSSTICANNQPRVAFTDGTILDFIWYSLFFRMYLAYRLFVQAVT